MLAEHDSNIVMFDVPPPYRGLRGIDEYRDAWPPFFDWQRQGATFEIEALLRCGKPEDFQQNPDNRLRLTIGLRKHDERWVVTHEHHSFCSTD